MRPSGRTPEAMRPVSLEPGVAKYAEGSCLARFGDTHVLCTASVEERVPPFLSNTGRGWVTAEYGMLPRSTHTRTDREAARGGPVSDGRDQGAPVAQPDYAEDSPAETDANFLLTGGGGIVEIQATAEGAPFNEASFTRMLALARAGIAELTRQQRAALRLV